MRNLVLKIKAKICIFLIIFMIFISANDFSEIKDKLIECPFKRGVNLANWLQASNARQIQFTKFTKQDFINIKNLGCDVIRLPINLHFMTNGQPEYIIDPLFFYFLDQVVNWAEELRIHLILDNHTFDPAVDTDQNVQKTLIPVWTQMARHYKDRSRYIYYEILNEPHGISDEKWNEIQQNVIHTIRSIDQKHTIVIGAAGWNSYNNLNNMSEYNDNNLIYTFHFYDPFLFTHQGAGWANPPMTKISGIPFPYDETKMQEYPKELKNTWIEDMINNYKNDGNVKRVKELINIAVDFKNKRKVPLFCGEFGVYIPNSNNEDRNYWYKVVRSYLEEKSIAWTIWDYTGDFGIFKKGSNEMFNHDLNIPLIEALGLKKVKQNEFVLKPEKAGFYIYSDQIEHNIYDESWMSSGILDYYSETNPAKGKFCIYWKDASQYNRIGFYFRPQKDLSLLVEKGFMIDFWIRCKSADVKFDVRFIDSKTANPDDHPWRKRFTFDESIIIADGKWQHIRIPLKDFTEQGSMDNNKWFNPVGDFDWSKVDSFEIVAEHYNMKGIEIWFDDIKIVQ
jgi:endoglucanase